MAVVLRSTLFRLHTKYNSEEDLYWQRQERPICSIHLVNTSATFTWPQHTFNHCRETAPTERECVPLSLTYRYITRILLCSVLIREHVRDSVLFLHWRRCFVGRGFSWCALLLVRVVHSTIIVFSSSRCAAACCSRVFLRALGCLLLLLLIL